METSCLPLIVIAILVCSFPHGITSIRVRGRCPIARGQSLFLPALYAGEWFELERFATIRRERDAVCVTHSEERVGLRDLRVTINGFSQRRRRRIAFSSTGLAESRGQAGRAEFSVSYSSDRGRKRRYTIVDTDYLTYSLVFVCLNRSLNRNEQYAYILTRRKGLEPANLDEIKAKLTDIGVGIANFVATDQSNCD